MPKSPYSLYGDHSRLIGRVADRNQNDSKRLSPSGAVMTTYDVPSNPAARGEVVVTDLTGLGPVDSPPASGEAASLTTFARTLFAPRVLVAGLEADVAFAGLAPGSIGVYQINFTVPIAAAPGIVDMTIEAHGARSNIAKLAIK